MTVNRAKHNMLNNEVRIVCKLNFMKILITTDFTFTLYIYIAIYIYIYYLLNNKKIGRTTWFTKKPFGVITWVQF